MFSILIIDDDVQIRKLLRQMLEQAGYDVVDAPDGNIAMQRYRESPADLIITDLIMPEKKGLETIHELRQQFADVKIIAISGGGRVGPARYLEGAEKLGAARTIEKPFTRAAILEAVRQLLPQD